MVLKYRHCDGNLCIKVTDNAVVSYIKNINKVVNLNCLLAQVLGV